MVCFGITPPIFLKTSVAPIERRFFGESPKSKVKMWSASAKIVSWFHQEKTHWETHDKEKPKKNTHWEQKIFGS